MDNGQQTQDDTHPIFPGVGNMPNPTSIEKDNLQGAGEHHGNWGNITPSRDVGDTGQNVLEVSSVASSETDLPPEIMPNPEQAPTSLGQVVDLETPPEPEQEMVPIETPEDSISSVIQEEIKTGNRLNKSGIRGAKSAINKLDSDGNPADFYNEVRDMTEANLKNSFGREPNNE